MVLWEIYSECCGGELILNQKILSEGEQLKCKRLKGNIEIF